MGPPVHLTWPKVARPWLAGAVAATTWTLLMNLTRDDAHDLSVPAVLAGATVGVALLVALTALVLQGSATRPPPPADP